MSWNARSQPCAAAITSMNGAPSAAMRNHVSASCSDGAVAPSPRSGAAPGRRASSRAIAHDGAERERQPGRLHADVERLVAAARRRTGAPPWPSCRTRGTCTGRRSRRAACRRWRGRPAARGRGARRSPCRRARRAARRRARPAPAARGAMTSRALGTSCARGGRGRFHARQLRARDGAAGAARAAAAPRRYTRRGGGAQLLQPPGRGPAAQPAQDGHHPSRRQERQVPQGPVPEGARAASASARARTSSTRSSTRSRSSASATSRRASCSTTTPSCARSTSSSSSSGQLYNREVSDEDTVTVIHFSEIRPSGVPRAAQSELRRTRRRLAGALTAPRTAAHGARACGGSAGRRTPPRAGLAAARARDLHERRDALAAGRAGDDHGCPQSGHCSGSSTGTPARKRLPQPQPAQNAARFPSSSRGKHARSIRTRAHTVRRRHCIACITCARVWSWRS